MATGVDPASEAGGESSRDGRRIGAILLFWGGLALIGRYGLGNVGVAGDSAASLGTSVALLFALTAVINVGVYAGARALRDTGRETRR